MGVDQWNWCKRCGLLMTVLSICVVLGIDAVEIDLIEDLYHNPSSRPIIQHRVDWSLNLTGDISGSNFLSHSTTEKIFHIFSVNRAFSLCVTLTQNLTNSGTILSIAYLGKLRFLEIKVSLKRKFVRVLYYPNWTKNGIRSEKLYFNTTQQKWQRLCIEYIGSIRELNLHVECEKVARVILKNSIPLENFANKNANEYKIWIGQKGSKSGLFKGVLKRMIFSDNGGYGSTYCVTSTVSSTETSSTFSNIQSDTMSDRISTMETELAELKQQLMETQKYLKEIKLCQCFPQCVGTNGEIKTFGDTWMQTPCSNCTCTLQGKVCHQRTCEKIPCVQNITDPGKCCPRCPYNCQYQRKTYPHNQTFSIRCMKCNCNDGTLSCRRINPETQCPTLTCHKFLQVKLKGQCCKSCKVLNLCELSKCGSNTQCMQSSSILGCQCKAGYTGNPYHGCVDINECQVAINKCQMNSDCVNTEGSYRCECKPGFVRVNNSSDICVATCPRNLCQNNSTCIGPDKCECKSGFTGPNCDIDIDECRLGLVKCPLNSECFNIPGGYICRCVAGYRTPNNDSLSISFDHQCADTDECQGTRGINHHCDTSSLCVNIPGGFRCIPKIEESQPFGSNCAIRRQNGDIALLYDKSSVNLMESCKMCRCQNGVLYCDVVKCDCSDKSLLSCCPKCLERNCDSTTMMLSRENGSNELNCSLMPTNCTNPTCPWTPCEDSILLPGQCCKYCRSDTVTSCMMVYNNMNTIVPGLIEYMPTCNTNGREYKSGANMITERFNDGSCLKCLCWNGHICCGKSFVCLDV